MSTVRDDRRGSIALTMALSLSVLIGLIGLGVDLGRLWLVQTRLQAAVDAGVLVAAREIGTASANANATALFWADFGRVNSETGEGYLGALVEKAPGIEKVDDDTVRMTANATVPTIFVAALGIGAQQVHAEASARRAAMGVELALVLDITGSMASNNNIGALRASATNLVNILYGSNDTRPNLWVSVVPYTASVNLGSQHTEWLAAGSLDQTAYAKNGWFGCVEARATPDDGTDATPASAPFKPFFWPSTLGKYRDSKGAVVVGDNDWSASTITELEQSKYGNATVGPNLSCPAAPVLPLTASKATVLETINGNGSSKKGLEATYRGGTLTNIGLQAGWFTLSDKWRGLWSKDPKDPLPLNYGTPYMRKVIVMMTDGENLWYDWEGGAPGKAPGKDYKPNIDADYTAYGRLSENRLGLDASTTVDQAIARARAKIDARVASLCTSIKNSGITVYTITFGVNNTNAQQLWRDCASKPDNYFNSPTQDALKAAFQQIGTQLANLRLTQ